MYQYLVLTLYILISQKRFYQASKIFESGQQLNSFLWLNKSLKYNHLNDATKQKFAIYKLLSSYSLEKVGTPRANSDPIKVIQFNLISIQNIPQPLIERRILNTPEYLGRYGKVKKMILTPDKRGAFVTYQNQFEASIALLALHNLAIQNDELEVFYGTSQYCKSFLEKVQCKHQNCCFLHQFERDREISTDKPEFKKKNHPKIAEEYILYQLKQFARMVAQQEDNQDEEQNQFPDIISVSDMLIEDQVIDEKQFKDMVNLVRESKKGSVSQKQQVVEYQLQQSEKSEKNRDTASQQAHQKDDSHFYKCQQKNIIHTILKRNNFLCQSRLLSMLYPKTQDIQKTSSYYQKNQEEFEKLQQIVQKCIITDPS